MTAINYVCTVCQARGVKLWRQTHTCASAIDLHCLDCAEKHAGEKLGKYGDQLMGFVPAVPTELPNEDGVVPGDETYWGYTSVPDWGCKWWHELPPQVGTHDPDRVYETREETAERKQRERDKTDAKIKAQFDETRYIMLVSDEAKHVLWERWHNVVEWDQICMGAWNQIGHIGDPKDDCRVCMSTSWFRIGGQLVAFVEPTSRFVDYDLVEEWIDKTFPVRKTFPGSKSLAKDCGIVGMHQCLAAVFPDWNKDSKRKARFEHIRTAMMAEM